MRKYIKEIKLEINEMNDKELIRELFPLEKHDAPDIDLKSYFDEVMNGYKDKYDIIYFAHSFGLIEYDVLVNEIQVKPIERSAYNRLRYDARVKIQILCRKN